VTARLPAGFESLEPFIERWALSTANERADMRGAAPAEERAAFYSAASDRLDEALAYLDDKGLAHFDEADQRLMRLMLSLAHVAMSEEVLFDQEPEHARYRAFMPIVRAPSDL
jgi:hypothetical protein